MLKALVDFGKQIVALNRDVQQCKSDLKSVQQEMKEVRQDIVQLRQDFGDLVRVVERLSFDNERTREHEAHERQLLVLRLENALLRYERAAPAPQNGSGGDLTRLE